jgi:hypothetical protein
MQEQVRHGKVQSKNPRGKPRGIKLNKWFSFSNLKFFGRGKPRGIYPPVNKKPRQGGVFTILLKAIKPSLPLL